MKRATEKVVYLLGAGFSQPLGLPVMANFLDVSRDIYYGDLDNPAFERFPEIFTTIAQMHISKSYYKTDLRNVEEVLSILAMEDAVTGKNRTETFTSYIKEVIKACEPQWPDAKIRTRADGARIIDREMHQSLMGGVNPHEEYRTFVACLLNLRLLGFANGNLEYAFLPDPGYEYSVVTLNYDRVIEACVNHLDKNCSPRLAEPSIQGRLKIAKLHGCVSKEVVPPTWRKGEMPTWLTEAWGNAYTWLSEATQIRILGYSLPPSDAYMRYLLEAAAIHSKYLKNIDVVCRSNDRIAMEKHYRSFFDFRDFRFKHGDVLGYLPRASSAPSSDFGDYIIPGLEQSRDFGSKLLEPFHDRFMKP